MKLIIAIYDENTTYMTRLTEYANRNMAEEFQLVPGDDTTSGAGIALISEEMYRQGIRPENMFHLVLCNINGVERVDGCPAIFRYQPADQLLINVRRIFVEQNRYETVTEVKNSKTNTVLFLSPAGGVGTSTMAMTFAIHAAQTGRRVILLDLTQFSGLGTMIRPVEQNLSETIFALKMKKNVVMSLKELLREDISGIQYFGITERLQDMAELEVEDVRLLIRTLKESGLADLIVIDADCRMDPMCETMKTEADRIFLISDGSETANLKVMRYAVALKQEGENEQIEKTGLIYNRFGSTEGEKLNLPWLKEFGGFQRIREAGARTIAEQFSRNALWDRV